MTKNVCVNKKAGEMKSFELKNQMKIPGMIVVSSSGGEGRKRKLTHARDVFHAWMLEGIDFSRPWDMPKLAAVDAHPTALVPFSVAMADSWRDYECFVHFFEDDFRFERMWNNPKKYLSKLSKFEGVVMPDFSTCIDLDRKSVV